MTLTDTTEEVRALAEVKTREETLEEPTGTIRDLHEAGALIEGLRKEVNLMDSVLSKHPVAPQDYNDAINGTS